MPSEGKSSEAPDVFHPVDAAMEAMQQHLSDGETVPTEVLGVVLEATQKTRLGTLGELILLAEAGALITRYRSTSKPVNGELQ